ncbi:VOC family protein [Streptomyces sp. WM6378]|uniref:VOC family protein n=1 Tax=Streptomyces sp. WM6378 TaxID=1415557 RepID=UPI0006AF11FB|nr:VOC family protein [Streptomyces sp. WM6378]KOU40153.1 3-demethylubiquinone-9 3-methyltransferase [Streptomyces sp. WM6378]
MSAKLTQKITTFLWFDSQAEEAANHYVSIFGGDSKIVGITRYTASAPGEPGSVMTVDFQLAGQRFTALNGGPQFSFTEAISLSVACESQEEIDTFWTKLSDGGEEGPCGWLKDKYGLSWQIVPAELPELLGRGAEKSDRVMAAVMGMKKLDLQAMRDA